jgi:predicted permease
MLDAVVGANRTFEHLAGVHERAVTISGGGLPEVLRLEAVSASYFEMLGAEPVAGAVWSEAAAQDPAGPAVALISAPLWRRRFGQDPNVLRRRVTIDGVDVRIAGVLPDSFRGLIGRTSIWVPLRLVTIIDATPGEPPRPWSRWFEVIGRIPAGRGLDEARAAIDVEARQAMAALPGADAALGSRWRATLTPLGIDRADARLARASTVLLGGVLFVLLLACVTLAGLQFIHVLGRAREFAVRLAVGGRRGDLAAMLAAEVALIVAAGTAGAMVLRQWTLHGILAVRPEPTGFGIRSAETLTPEALALDPALLAGFAAGAALSGFVIAGLALLAVRRNDFAGWLRGAAGASAALSFSRTAGSRIAAALVGAEVALAVVLLSGAGLMARTAANLWAQERGFTPDGVLTFRLEPPDRKYEGAALAALHATVVERLAALPGVEAISVSNCLPGTGRCRRTNVREVDGRPLDLHRAPTVGVHYVAGPHFDLLRTPVVRGRGFDAGDAGGRNAVAIVNEAAAARLWPGQDPIGRRVALYFASGRNTEAREVVGVVSNIRFDPVERDPQPDVYLPAAQVAWQSSAVFLRLSETRPATWESIRSAIASVDPDLPVHDVAPLTARLGAGFAAERLLAAVLAAFAVAALSLAAVGVHALAAHAVARGSRELAIRMALGATRMRIVRALAGRAGWLLALGLTAGVAAAMFTGRLLSAFLFEIQPRDPYVLASIVLIVSAAALAALAVPLRRAALVDPSTVLMDD